MKSKHTPGPWVVETTETDNIILQGEDSDQIATCDRAFGDANARLIAAAPELLHNCMETMRALSVVRDHFEVEGKTELVHDIETEIKCLALVVAKAIGGAL